MREVKKERYHLYLYTVEIRREEQLPDGRKVVHWDGPEQVEGYSIVDVVGKLKRKVDEIRYVTKEIIK